MHSSMEMQQVSCPMLPDVLGDGDSQLEKLCEIQVVLLGRVVGKRMCVARFSPRSGFSSHY